MTVDMTARALFSLLCLFLLGWVVRLWSEYRVDAFRDDLFALRDELFDRAALGIVSFSHPAYVMLRTGINSVIRFAHRVTLFWLVEMWIFPPDPKNKILTEYVAKWENSLADLSPEAKRTLRGIHYRLGRRFIQHLLPWPVFMLGVVLVRILRAINQNAMATVANSELRSAAWIEVRAQKEDAQQRHTTTRVGAADP